MSIFGVNGALAGAYQSMRTKHGKLPQVKQILWNS